MEILSAELNDCDEIIRLQRLAYESEAQLYQDWTIPPLTQTADDFQHEFSELTILKAVNTGEIIGSVRAQLIGDVCYIGRLIVHPAFQKQGVGSRLLQEIEQTFAHAKTYELFTGNKSESNIRFYLTQGYQISHTQNASDHLALVYLTKSIVN